MLYAGCSKTNYYPAKIRKLFLQHLWEGVDRIFNGWLSSMSRKSLSIRIFNFCIYNCILRRLTPFSVKLEEWFSSRSMKEQRWFFNGSRVVLRQVKTSGWITFKWFKNNSEAGQEKWMIFRQVKKNEWPIF